MSEGGDTSLVGILPLLAAGFIFNNIYYATKFRLSKADGQRLFFSCVITGFVIGVIAFLACFAVRTLIPPHSFLRSTLDWMHKSVPVPYGLTFIATMLLAYMLGHAGNVVLWLRKRRKAPKDKRRVSVWVYWRTMPEYITAMDDLFRRALTEDALVLICLKSRKVYCGLITETRGDHDSAIAHVQFLPSFSITRDKDTLLFDWNTKTEYRAYSLKRASERRKSLDALITKIKELINAAQNLAAVSQPPLANHYRDLVAPLQQQLAAQEQEHASLSRVLSSYSHSGEISISEWVKVIPVTEIESVSIYMDDDHAKWFDHGIGTTPNSSAAPPQMHAG